MIATITITPYLVVKAVLELLTDISEGVMWLTGFFEDTAATEGERGG